MHQRVIAYIRTSTNRQDLGLEFQLEQVRQYHPDKIFHEQISGRKRDRPELTKALSEIQPGDQLLVYKLDRLGRSTKQLVNIIAELDVKGAHFKSIHDNINTETINGRFLFTILSAVAELEANMISERTKDALKMTTKKLGRPVRITSDTKEIILHNYAESKLTVKEIATRNHVSPAYVYRLAHQAGLSRTHPQQSNAPVDC
ncbi:recombinase family protein [Furfurilactobacillus milii]|uniref:Recombinase family protein n=1 Tax=Furfurilactobacillus milii TaxID=2888272 RepID=A0A6N9I572_9LACO|nr:recombinase family protein [Furfurilactobacillus milii]MYV18028.1 recombinase family protein [Furfurilactobacillus milii]